MSVVFLIAAFDVDILELFARNELNIFRCVSEHLNCSGGRLQSIAYAVLVLTLQQFNTYLRCAEGMERILASSRYFSNIFSVSRGFLFSQEQNSDDSPLRQLSANHFYLALASL